MREASGLSSGVKLRRLHLASLEAKVCLANSTLAHQTAECGSLAGGPVLPPTRSAPHLHAWVKGRERSAPQPCPPTGAWKDTWMIPGGRGESGFDYGISLASSAPTASPPPLDKHGGAVTFPIYLPVPLSTECVGSQGAGGTHRASAPRRNSLEAPCLTCLQGCLLEPPVSWVLRAPSLVGNHSLPEPQGQLNLGVSSQMEYVGRSPGTSRRVAYTRAFPVVASCPTSRCGCAGDALGCAV